MIIKSPYSGIVLTEGIENLTNNYVTEGAGLLDVAETKHWDALLFVDENDIHQIKVNDKVNIKLMALQSTKDYNLYKGIVTSIGEEKINPADNYSNFIGLYRVSVKLIFGKDNGTDITKMKYQYKVNGEIITDSGKIVDMLIKYYNKLL